MAVRNFWLEGCEGRVRTGPVRKDDGFTLKIKMRDDGGIVEAAVLTGDVRTDGTLILEIRPKGGDKIEVYRTKR